MLTAHVRACGHEAHSRCISRSLGALRAINLAVYLLLPVFERPSYCYARARWGDARVFDEKEKAMKDAIRF